MTLIERYESDPMPGVPEHLREGLRRYIVHGIPVGGFLTAVLTNDLSGAMMRGDPDSLAGLAGLVRYLYNDAPEACWGSPATVQEWIASRGLQTIEVGS